MIGTVRKVAPVFTGATVFLEDGVHVALPTGSRQVPNKHEASIIVCANPSESVEAMFCACLFGAAVVTPTWVSCLGANGASVQMLRAIRVKRRIIVCEQFVATEPVFLLCYLQQLMPTANGHWQQLNSFHVC